MRMSLPAHSKAKTLPEAKEQSKEQQCQCLRADHGVAQFFSHALNASIGAGLSCDRQISPQRRCRPMCMTRAIRGGKAWPARLLCSTGPVLPKLLAREMAVSLRVLKLIQEVLRADATTLKENLY
jgi:hypothetical protein